jgi:hypothetical protein
MILNKGTHMSFWKNLCFDRVFSRILEKNHMYRTSICRMCSMAEYGVQFSFLNFINGTAKACYGNDSNRRDTNFLTKMVKC